MSLDDSSPENIGLEQHNISFSYIFSYLFLPSQFFLGRQTRTSSLASKYRRWRS